MDLDIGREYGNVAGAYGLDLDELGRITIEGIESTWLDDSDRRSLASEFEAALRAVAEPPNVQP